MPAPTNISAATAVEMTPLPYSIVQDVHDGISAVYDVWYKHTCETSGELSVFGSGIIGGGTNDYTPYVNVYTGEPASLTPYLTFDEELSQINLPIQIPVVEGTTYYFEFKDPAIIVAADPADLTLVAQLHTPLEVPFGAIIVPDDTDGFPATAVHPTSGAILRFFHPVPSSEAADVLTGGIIAIADKIDGDVSIFSPDLSEVLVEVTASVDAAHGGNVRTCLGTNRFWILEDLGATCQARYLTSDGVLGTAHTLTGSTRVDCIAANNDETILFYTHTVITDRAIRAWDLVNDVALADFAAEIPDYFTWDILVLADDSILVSYVDTGAPDFKVLRYNAAGTVLNTYEFGSAFVVPNDAPPRLAYGTNDETFWTWTHPDGVNEGKSVFTCVNVSDGATVSASTPNREFEFGIYNDDPTATPDAYFGNSFSCPFFLLRTEIPDEPPDDDIPNGPPGLVELENQGVLRVIPTVRQRITPHTSDEMQRIFVPWYQLDMQPGVGIADGQGEDPKVEICWSNDGAHTWSNGRTMTLGRQGQYDHRAITWQCGSFRTRTVKLTMSDPVPTVWIDLYFGPEDSTQVP